MAGVSISIRRNDHEWNAFIKRTKMLNISQIKVGFPEEAKVKSGPRKGSNREPFTSMAELAYVAAIHEYGSNKKNIPARPFMRPALDKNENKIVKLANKAVEKIFQKKETVNSALNIIGDFIVAAMRKEIDKLKSPVLDVKTIARKGSSKLLIDSKQMYNSITHIIKMGRGKNA
jgi:hypothetical protein